MERKRAVGDFSGMPQIAPWLFIKDAQINKSTENIAYIEVLYDFLVKLKQKRRSRM